MNKLAYITILQEHFACLRHDKEVSATLFLTPDMHIADLWITQGSHDNVMLPVQDIIRHARRSDMGHIILCHTHPSNNPRPSKQDIVTTRALSARLRRNGRRLFDHIILSQQHYFSFRARNML